MGQSDIKTRMTQVKVKTSFSGKNTSHDVISDALH